MNRIIRCKNTASGQIKVVTGPYVINNTLLDTISLMLSISDKSKSRHPILSYDLDTIELVGGDSYLGQGVFGKAFPAKRTVLVSPRALAQYTAKEWLSEFREYTSYAAFGTGMLLLTILHEALHTHAHRKFVATPEIETLHDVLKEEEAWVNKASNELLLQFVKDYGIDFITTTLMWGLVTEELSKCENGRRLVEAQADWIVNGVVCKDVDGIQTLSIREDFRQRIEPGAHWKLLTKTTKEALEEILAPEPRGAEHYPVSQYGLDFPKEYDTVEKEVVVAQVATEEATITTSVLTSTTPPPPPPATRPVPPPPVVAAVPPPPPSRPEPPIEAYEEYNWMAAEAALIEKANTSVQPSDKTIATAIMQSDVYSAPHLPAKAPKNVETIIIDIGKKLFRHIFLNCDYSTKSTHGFLNPEGVYKEIDFQDIPGADDIIQGYEAQDAMGRGVKEEYRGTVRGKVLGTTKLPTYQITFKDGGRTFSRLFLPQNLDKKKPNGEPSYTADRARKYGTRYMWVLDTEVSDFSVGYARNNDERATKFVGKYENEVYTAIAT